MNESLCGREGARLPDGVVGDGDGDAPAGVAEGGHAQVVVVVEERHALPRLHVQPPHEARNGGGFARGGGVDVGLAQVEARGEPEGREPCGGGGCGRGLVRLPAPALGLGSRRRRVPCVCILPYTYTQVKSTTAHAHTPTGPSTPPTPPPSCPPRACRGGNWSSSPSRPPPTRCPPTRPAAPSGP